LRASDKTFPKSLFYAVSEFCLTFERLPFSGLGFQSVGRAKFSVPMWLGTQGTRIQFTGLVDGCGASGTSHCVDLFSGKFSGLHCPIMERSKAGMLLNIAHDYSWLLWRGAGKRKCRRRVQ
jgi:hypothetical protein